MTRLIPLIIVMLVASGCAYAPPGAGSHARFVRTEGATDLAYFAAIELGAVLGENLQFSPAVTGIIPLWESFTSFLIVFGVAFNVDY